MLLILAGIVIVLLVAMAVAFSAVLVTVSTVLFYLLVWMVCSIIPCLWSSRHRAHAARELQNLWRPEVAMGLCLFIGLFLLIVIISQSHPSFDHPVLMSVILLVLPALPIILMARAPRHRRRAIPEVDEHNRKMAYFMRTRDWNLQHGQWQFEE